MIRYFLISILVGSLAACGADFGESPLPDNSVIQTGNPTGNPKPKIPGFEPSPQPPAPGPAQTITLEELLAKYPNLEGVIDNPQMPCPYDKLIFTVDDMEVTIQFYADEAGIDLCYEETVEYVVEDSETLLALIEPGFIGLGLFDEELNITITITNYDRFLAQQEIYIGEIGVMESVAGGPPDEYKNDWQGENYREETPQSIWKIFPQKKFY